MREVVFIKRNSEKWKKFESAMSQKNRGNPDELASVYIQVIEDLSYARTFFPGSKTINYLNNLSAKIHQNVYQAQNIERRSVKMFWMHDLPLLFYRHRTLLAISLLIFLAAVIIGIISAANDTRFIRMILGESYVRMTESNIAKGDPMAVYKESMQIEMFLGITFNNIRVSFYAFISGIFGMFGTGFVLLKNGVLFGAFEYLFYQHGMLGRSLLTVMIHGILELSAIVIAGGAGLLLGKGLLMPGTYTRRVSFMMAAREGIKIIMGLIPIFIIAGFLESFITRYTQMPLVINIILLAATLGFIIWYVILFPKIIAGRESYGK